ncbi:MAG: ABC transporter ATP-binding protein [Burkholderiaceae bacterium]|nr:ABC transporter ATP-binding protein [Burkholderiaceae bacterium]
MSDPLLVTDALQTVLETEAGLAHAVDCLSLTIERRETFALVGESGCGKSMTALSLLRLLPDNGRIAGGSIRLQGQDLCALRELDMQRVRGARIGIIFQEPSTSLNPVMSVGRQVTEVIERHTALRGAAARARAIEWFERVGLPEPQRRFDTYPFQMSGGQKQRVMIALALAAEPDLLIADEPTTALDVTIQGQILELLVELQRDQGMGMLLITHDLGIVHGMAHRVALMYAGQIVEVTDTARFFAQPRHPYAQLLLKALPGAGKRGDPLAAIAGTVPALTGSFSGCRFRDRCDRAMPACEVEPPELIDGGLGHAVRCLLYANQSWQEVAPAAASAAPSPDAKPDPAAAPPIPEAIGSASPAPDNPFATTIERAFGRFEAALEPAASRSIPSVPERAVAIPERTESAREPEMTAGQAGARSGDLPPPTFRAADDDGPIVQVERLSVRFPIRKGMLLRTTGYVQAVRDVSFELHPGQTLALVGESGCGKTTIGKAMLQLLRGVARIDGRALLGGRDLFELNGQALRSARRDIQIVFQDPFASLNPRLRVMEVLEEGMITLMPQLDAPARRSRIEDLIDRVGLRRDVLNRYPHEFSGGQRQRIAIARALAVSPRVIVCDEPTSALDVSVQAQILNLLRELQRDMGMSYLFITHNIGVVEYIADRVAVMQAGELLEQGPASQVLEHPIHDYTRSLLAAVPRVDGPLRARS